MKILSFDQASKISGFCLMKNSQYIDSGIIDKHKISDSDARIGEMGVAICEKIEEIKPDLVVIENIQQQSGVSTVILLARLQGFILGWCYVHNIKVKILAPSQWRKELKYRQGSGVKRAELKQQSIDYVKEHYGFDDFSEDQCEAICICTAASKLFDDIWDESYWEN